MMVREKEEAAQTIAEERLPNDPMVVSEKSSKAYESTLTSAHSILEVPILAAQPCLTLLCFLSRQTDTVRAPWWPSREPSRFIDL